MPRGLPDYFNPDTIVSQRLANVEEVVTAVQGLANLDNRGRTLHFDHFSEGVSGWIGAVIGDASVPVASISKAEIPPASMKIDAGTLSGGGQTQAYKRFRIENISGAGLEIGLCYDADTPDVRFGLQYDNGTYLLSAEIQLDVSAKMLQIRDGVAFTDVYALAALSGTVDWLLIKLVVDFEAPDYVRLLVGLDQIDISDYTVYAPASSREGLFNALLTVTAQDDGSNIAYIGHVAITIDEP